MADLIRLDFDAWRDGWGCRSRAVTVYHSVCVLARTVTRDDKGDCCRSSNG